MTAGVHSFDVCGVSCTKTGDPVSSSGTFSTTFGTKFAAVLGTPHRVERENRRATGLDPILFGMFLQCNRANQKSVPVSFAFASRRLAILTAASDVPFACWWCGADVTSSKSQSSANFIMCLFTKFVALSVSTLCGFPCRAKFS
ncbi:uncharacterized protein LOC119769163 [Culex quinquefasciatus]|uniref:uncharacterized protein LOC119769163 n=1 Tax=Culex quinquefasciatus TaxID=7176 RepID=UPI0018E306C9|nr:uncharacterized protein LOC119769163 [Culex quinquefasciatus]